MTEDSSQISKASDAAFNDYIRRARETKRKTPDVFTHPSLDSKERERLTILTGTVMGIAASLIFAIVSQGVNLALLPSLPLFQSRFDPFFNIVMILVIGTILGFVSVSSFKVQNRFIALALVLAGLFIVYRFYRAFGSLVAGVMQGLAFSFIFLIPILFGVLCLAPFGMLVRWAVRPQVKYFYKPLFFWKRVVPPLVLMALSVLSGMLFVYSTPEQKAIRNMDALVKSSLAARTEEELPGVVRNIWGTPFQPYAEGDYYILAQHNPIPTRVRANGTPFVMPIYISAQFQSGYWFTCDFVQSGTVVECGSGYEPPAEKLIGMVR